MARLCALVPQEPRLLWSFTVREAVMMGRAPHQGLLALPGPLDHGAVEGALQACDLAHLADRRVETLSGGERRRVFFARALAQEPRVLLLDEPTASLDPRHRFLVLDVLRRRAASGASCVFSTHEVDLAARAADDAVLLARGKVLASGPVRESVTERSLSELLGVAARITTLPSAAQFRSRSEPPNEPIAVRQADTMTHSFIRVPPPCSTGVRCVEMFP